MIKFINYAKIKIKKFYYIYFHTIQCNHYFDILSNLLS